MRRETKYGNVEGRMLFELKSFFFPLIGKKQLHEKKPPKGSNQSTHNVYNGSQKHEKEKGKQKYSLPPLIQLNQTIKSTKGMSRSSINKLDQESKLFKKWNFSLCIESLTFFRITSIYLLL